MRRPSGDAPARDTTAADVVSAVRDIQRSGGAEAVDGSVSAISVRRSIGIAGIVVAVAAGAAATVLGVAEAQASLQLERPQLKGVPIAMDPKDCSIQRK